MSAIASFYLLNRSDLRGLVRAAATPPQTPMESPAFDYLDGHARDLDSPEQLFPWSGYVMLHLLTFLEESGVDLGAECRDETAAINETYADTHLLTAADKRHLPALNAATLDRDAAAEFFDDMDYTFDGLDEALDDGLGVLSQSLTALTQDEVLIVHIG